VGKVSKNSVVRGLGVFINRWKDFNIESGD